MFERALLAALTVACAVGCAMTPDEVVTSSDDTPSATAAPGSRHDIVDGNTNLPSEKLELGNDTRAITVPWAKRVGGTGDDYANTIAVDSSGNSYVSGTFEGTVAFGGTCGSLTASGTDDMWLGAFNASGVCTWVKSFGATSATTAPSALVIDSSNIYVTGIYSASTSFGASTLTNAGGWDCFVASYTLSSGAGNWAKNCGANPGDDIGYGIAVRGTKVAVAGELGINAQDAFLTTYVTTTGAVSWTKSVGSTGYDSGRAVGIDSSGNVYFSGGFSGSVVFILLAQASNGGIDGFAVEYNSTGTALASNTFGSTSDDYGVTGVVDSADHFILSGVYRGSQTILSGSVTGNSNPSLFVEKLNVTLGAFWETWIVGITSTTEVYGDALTVDGSNNVYVGGAFGGTSNFGGGNHVSVGGVDAIVAKFSSGSGAWISDSTFGSTGDDEAEGIGYYAGGSSVIAAGYFHGSVTIGSTGLTSAGNADADLYSLTGM